MPRRHVLLLTAECLIAHRWLGGQLPEEGEFPADAEGVSTFTAWLERHRDDLFHLLVDLPDEGFHGETLPRAYGRDRQALIQRKLGQFFHGTPLALAQGQSQDGRHGERLLFCALTAPQRIEPWLNALRATGVALVGVWSVPLVLPALMQAARGLCDHCLLITVGRAGVRQTFFRAGQLHFSRLTPLVGGSIDEAALTTARECAKINHYLVGQRLLAREAPLACLIVAHPAQFELFRHRCHDSNEVRFFYLDLTRLALTTGCHTPLHDSRGDLLFLHLLMRRPPPGQFAPANELLAYRLWQRRFALKATSGVILGAALIVAGKLWHDTRTLMATTEQLQRRIAEAEARHNQALTSLPAVPFSLAELRALVAAWEPIERQGRSLRPTLAALARAMNEFPAIDIDHLNWALAHAGEEDTPAAVGTRVLIDLDARLPLAMLNDHRGQIRLIDAFVARLQREGAGVRIVRLPFEIESAKSLRSSDRVGSAEAPHFTLRLDFAPKGAP